MNRQSPRGEVCKQRNHRGVTLPTGLKLGMSIVVTSQNVVVESEEHVKGKENLGWLVKVIELSWECSKH